jgi:hypothetical protein
MSPAEARNGVPVIFAVEFDRVRCQKAVTRKRVGG